MILLCENDTSYTQAANSTVTVYLYQSQWKVRCFLHSSNLPAYLVIAKHIYPMLLELNEHTLCKAHIIICVLGPKKSATIPVSLSLAVDACSTGKGLVVCYNLWPCAVPTPLPDTCLHTWDHTPSVFWDTPLTHDASQMKAIAKHFINPRRACATRVTVLGLCVCLSVCLLPPPRATNRPKSYTNRFSATLASF